MRIAHVCVNEYGPEEFAKKLCVVEQFALNIKAQWLNNISKCNKASDFSINFSKSAFNA